MSRKKKVILIAAVMLAVYAGASLITAAAAHKSPASTSYTDEELVIVRQLAAEQANAVLSGAVGNKESSSLVLGTERWLLSGNDSSSSSETPSDQTKDLTDDVSEVLIRYVIDGDTMIVCPVGMTRKENSFKIRLIGCDTPESVCREEYTAKSGKQNTVFGKSSSQFSQSSLSADQKVYLTYDASTEDDYGRHLVYLWTSRPETLSEAEFEQKCYNARLVSEGYAVTMCIAPNTRYAEAFNRLQLSAMTDRRGLWADLSWWEFQGY